MTFLGKFFTIHSMTLAKNVQLNTDALTDIVNRTQTYFDEGMLSSGVFIDVKKAFDTLTHGFVPLQKLHRYGVRGIINDWLHSYLTDRVKSNKICSYCLWRPSGFYARVFIISPVRQLSV